MKRQIHLANCIECKRDKKYKCYKCKKIKSEDEFYPYTYKNRNRTVTKFCIKCYKERNIENIDRKKEYDKKRYQKNKDKFQKRSIEYYHANKEERKKYYTKYKHGYKEIVKKKKRNKIAKRWRYKNNKNWRNNMPMKFCVDCGIIIQDPDNGIISRAVRCKDCQDIHTRVLRQRWWANNSDRVHLLYLGNPLSDLVFEKYQSKLNAIERQWGWTDVGKKIMISFKNSYNKLSDRKFTVCNEAMLNRYSNYNF